jgi:hypothetical protein
MVNPFDHNFFKFFVGFIFILVVSFGVLYIAGSYSGAVEKKANAIQQ